MHRGASKRCRCGKTFFSTYRQAMKKVNRTDAERPYFCFEAGGYHITGIPKSEWDAAQALRVVV